MFNIICLFILVLIFSNTQQFDIETCRYPLGIETGKILDSAFSSSSNAGLDSTPSKARIRSESNGWCPSKKISTTTYEYIQIDLGNLTVITLIELQGKFSEQPNEQYADSFRIEYRRENNQKWIKYKDFSGQYILSGNTNSHIPTIRDILPSLVAKQIRIIPIVSGPKAKHVCMRLELYGCSYQAGPISYSIPQGDRRSYDIRFFDETYDGQNENGTLNDGLGQLTDGIIAKDDYRTKDNVQGIGDIGYDWIGWKRKPSTWPNISLHFYFETIRNFTSISLHASNLMIRDIYLFNTIIIANCKDETSKTFSLIKDDKFNSQARFINVSLFTGYGIVAQCLKITLTFHNRSKWILISEVEFKSEPIINYTNVLLLPTTLTHLNQTRSSIDNEWTIVHYWHWLILASFILLLVLLSLIFVYIQWIRTCKHQRKLRKMKNHFKFDTIYQPISMQFPTRSKIGCCCSTTADSTPLDGNSTCSTSNNDIRRQLIISTTCSSSSGRVTSTSDFGTISTTSPATISTVYQSVFNPYLTAVATDTPNVTSNPYASIDMYTHPTISILSSDKTFNTNNSLKSIQGPCGNSTYQSSITKKFHSTKDISHINDEQLIIEDCYSTNDQSFGRILRGYIYLRHPYDILKPILIKALTTDDPIQKTIFDKEHDILNRLHHPNIVQFFGYTVKQQFALIEHSNLGDLHTFLSTSQCTQREHITSSINIRLLIITQLSNALRYLQSESIIHRDISARNCLIYPNYEIKLTNCALASAQFQSHYFNINHARLPIRWMAPETIANNEFNFQSDIWSFGITLWEVMTNCSALPYALLNDEEVYQRLQFMGKNSIESTGTLQLSKPECLSKELVDLMLECWRPCGERPTFHEIFTFFHKRLEGINIV